MKYVEGTINIANNSHVVTGNGVSWFGVIEPGWFLVIESLIGAFQISKVTATTLELTDKINLGTIAAASGLDYIACKDFSPHYGLIIPGSHDLDKVTPLQKALELFDKETPLV